MNYENLKEVCPNFTNEFYEGVYNAIDRIGLGAYLIDEINAIRQGNCILEEDRNILQQLKWDVSDNLADYICGDKFPTNECEFGARFAKLIGALEFELGLSHACTLVAEHILMDYLEFLGVEEYTIP